MQADEITLRLRTKQGTYRIKVDPAISGHKLKDKIAAELNIPNDKQTISLDPKHTKPLLLDSSLAKQQVSHGQMLYLKYPGVARPANKSPVKLGQIKSKWTMTEYLKHLDDKGLVFAKQEKAVCTQASLDWSAANAFQLYCRQFAFQKQRIGYLYGSFQEDGSVEVDVIYEPDQEATSSSFVLLDNKKEETRVQALADMLGYSLVGWIVAHPPDRDVEILNSSEVVKAAQLQAEAADRHKLGKHFVTFRVTLDDEGQAAIDAYQVTNQCLKLLKANEFTKPKDQKHVSTKEPMLMHMAGAGRKDSTEIEATLLLQPVRVNAEPYKGKLKCGQFPIENRKDQPQNKMALKKCLQGQASFLDKMRDFHVLLFLSRPEYLDMTTDIPALVKAVLAGNSQEVEGFKLLINNFAGLT